MIKHEVIDELLENKSIKKLADSIYKHEEVSVYQLQFPSVKELQKEAYQWAYSLFNNCESGDPRPEPIKHKNRLVLQHPEGFRIRTYYASGYIEYRQLKRTYTGRTDVSNLKDADSIIREFGSKNGLWPLNSDGQIQAEGIRFVRSQGCSSKGEKTEVLTNNVITIYKRLTNGIPWIGPGSRITAMIEERDVVAFNRYWRQVTPKQVKVQLLSIENAVEAMVKDLSSRLDNRNIQPEDLILESAEFGYYAAEKRKLQRFLQPAYIFTYHTTGKFATGFVDVRLAHNKKLEKLVDDPELPLGQLKRRALTEKS